MTPPMDPPDVEMEMEPAPQPPAPTAVGEGWSMLSRARGLLEEGKPSLALQAIDTAAFRDDGYVMSLGSLGHKISRR
ncbi:uncharacterized protein [Zea mays]|uniref:uncharacterized protein isoform X1 n=1 Tax=Zea mays TaxID=4577 RepID=UPI0009A97F91|nr:uncharacterized protein LOC100278233 isoform X1 [Zea mays]|eukprot:XP_020408839.1 uncharacterized protein LOC100278233 isoform X1 [Zea mays]